MRSRGSVVIVVLTMTGCSYKADSAVAITATDDFRKLMDRGDYGSIYDNNATGGLHTGISRDDFVNSMDRINRKMGKCDHGPAILSGYRTATTGTLITISSTSMCQNGKLDERFDWVMVAGQPALRHYTANNRLTNCFFKLTRYRKNGISQRCRTEVRCLVSRPWEVLRG
jgi:hypothetical protein